MGFNYVDVVGEGCEGWINLFFNDECIALIRDTDLALKIKMSAQSRHFKKPVKNKTSDDKAMAL